MSIIDDFKKQVYEEGYADGKRDAVKHGHWVQADLDHNYVTCSNCKELNRDDRLAFIPDYAKGMHYCMICGAKMDAFANDINVSCKSDEVTE